MNFDFVGKCDITEIKKTVSEMDEHLWKKHTLRQTLTKPHTNTETIELIWDFESLNNLLKGKEHEELYSLKIDKFLESIYPLYYEKYGKGTFVRVLLVKLKKLSKIKPHIDSGIGLEIAKRTHLAIITNDLVKFTVNNETKNLKEGDIWEIDNQLEHSVENDSEIDRIHLIIDYYVSKKNQII